MLLLMSLICFWLESTMNYSFNRNKTKTIQKKLHTIRLKSYNLFQTWPVKPKQLSTSKCCTLPAHTTILPVGIKGRMRLSMRIKQMLFKRVSFIEINIFSAIKSYGFLSFNTKEIKNDQILKIHIDSDEFCLFLVGINSEPFIQYR